MIIRAFANRRSCSNPAAMAAARTAAVCRAVCAALHQAGVTADRTGRDFCPVCGSSLSQPHGDEIEVARDRTHGALKARPAWRNAGETAKARRMPCARSCRCGAITLEVDAALTGLVECNGPTCARHGILHSATASGSTLPRVHARGRAL
jgi:hypothetical protein